ncbi:hypothetical protein [Longitalea luteola]|uniref:hypothetical protein n=1 Tax=Longitalea luteola TaxID=2812563 RepID=UPI001A961E4F|nr:hypothetical protein [Longitalea luteola]
MNKDLRETLPAKGSFYELVVKLHQEKQQAAMLYDDGGVTRANGFITTVFEKDGKHWLRLDDQLEIDIEKLYAINGLFSSDYSEC